MSTTSMLLLYPSPAPIIDALWRSSCYGKRKRTRMTLLQKPPCNKKNKGSAAPPLPSSTFCKTQHLEFYHLWFAVNNISWAQNEGMKKTNTCEVEEQSPACVGISDLQVNSSGINDRHAHNRDVLSELRSAYNYECKCVRVCLWGGGGQKSEQSLNAHSLCSHINLDPLLLHHAAQREEKGEVEQLYPLYL